MMGGQGAVTVANLKTTENEKHKPRIIAAIPCFNEERFIGSVVLKARRYVDKVLVIDDGSSDATAEVAGEAGGVVLRHDCNQGKGAALQIALRRGREEGADILVILDGDGQHDPRDIPRLVQPLLDGGADVVVGSRFIGAAGKPPFYRRLGQHILTSVSNLGSGSRVTDSQSGFRAFSSKALQSLKLTENGFAVESELLFAMSKSGLRVIEVPISVSYLGKAKRNPLGHGLNVLSRVLVLISLKQPLLLFGIPGIMLLVGGLLLGIRVLDIYSKTSGLAIGTFLTAMLLCLTGVLALFAALMLQSMKELLRREWEHFDKTQVESDDRQDVKTDYESR
jgi:glycosyltransferase involved in cell wall biosynthesis